jgi:hypothetical protein
MQRINLYPTSDNISTMNFSSVRELVTLLVVGVSMTRESLRPVGRALLGGAMGFTAGTLLAAIIPLSRSELESIGAAAHKPLLDTDAAKEQLLTAPVPR